MTVTTLDANTALIVIDLQKGIIGLPAAHPVDAVVKNASVLAEAFRAHGLPVVLVTVVGQPPSRTEVASNVAQMPAGWTDLAAELDQQPSDHLVMKRNWGAFTNTGLDEYLKGRNVTQVVIVGVATSIGVESTARHARELGFHVTLAADAMTDRSMDAHVNSMTRIFPRLGETGVTQDIIGLLDKRGA